LGAYRQLPSLLCLHLPVLLVIIFVLILVILIVGVLVALAFTQNLLRTTRQPQQRRISHSLKLGHSFGAAQPTSSLPLYAPQGLSSA
jgi:anionic cell wall polymer biosynthesis LytR-Cps2A-Psr (LCP) family protein